MGLPEVCRVSGYVRCRASRRCPTLPLPLPLPCAKHASRSLSSHHDVVCPVCLSGGLLAGRRACCGCNVPSSPPPRLRRVHTSTPVPKIPPDAYTFSKEDLHNHRKDSSHKAADGTTAEADTTAGGTTNQTAPSSSSFSSSSSSATAADSTRLPSVDDLSATSDAVTFDVGGQSPPADADGNTPSYMVMDHWDRLSDPHTVSVVGAPMQYGQGLDGTEDAPDALRETGLMRSITQLGWRVRDRGGAALGGVRTLACLLAHVRMHAVVLMTRVSGVQGTWISCPPH